MIWFKTRDKWQAFVSMVMNILVAVNEGEGFLTTSGIIAPQKGLSSMELVIICVMP